MKKTLIITLAIAATLTFASCGDKNESGTSKGTATTNEQTTAEAITTTETEAVVTDRLSFLEKGEMYFDINLSSGVFDDLKIKVGDQEVTSSGKIKFNGTDKPEVEGNGSGKDIYVVIYSDGFVNEVLIETSYLQKTLEIDFRTFAKEKSYVYISDKADGYDTSLDSSLLEFIKTHISE